MTTNPQRKRRRRLPCLCGADIELGNFIAGVDRAGGTGFEAARAVLEHIPGYPRLTDPIVEPRFSPASDKGSSSYSVHGYGRDYDGATAYRDGSSACGSSYDPQDVGRRFLANTAGAAYIDLSHLELPIPEVISCFDHVSAWHGALRIAREALNAANEKRPPDRRIRLLVNSTDHKSNSYGAHQNFLISRRLYENIFRYKPHYLGALASFQACNILLTGQGKVGSENSRPHVAYQISQRADFIETLCSINTTFNRPLVNSRDEPLAGRISHLPDAPARLHVICYDSALAHGSCLFRVGLMQLLLAEMDLGLVNPRLILDDPLAALHSFNRDPGLEASARSIGGRRLTALELQCEHLEFARRCAASGVFDGIVPHADLLLERWQEALCCMIARDWTGLARCGIDWVLKLHAIERALDQQPLDWRSPELLVLDALYGSLDDDGLYWAFEDAGIAGRLVSPERIAHFASNPPEDTRAWTRAMLLRRAAEEGIPVTAVDWDSITFRFPGRYAWPTYRRIELANPLRFTRTETERFFLHSPNFSTLLDEIESLSASESRAGNSPAASTITPVTTGETDALPAKIQ